MMWIRAMGFVLLVSSLVGCTKIEAGFRYEYDGRLFRMDGKTPAKGVSLRLARVDAPPPPEMPEKYEKKAAAYMDHAVKIKSDSNGRYLGVLETVKGWTHHEYMGMTSGPTKAPLPPEMSEVILYVQEKNVPWVGYRISVPPESQKEAYSGVRKLHLPDLLLPDKPTSKPATTQSVTQSAQP